MKIEKQQNGLVTFPVMIGDKAFPPKVEVTEDIVIEQEDMETGLTYRIVLSERDSCELVDKLVARSEELQRRARFGEQTSEPLVDYQNEVDEEDC